MTYAVAVSVTNQPSREASKPNLKVQFHFKLCGVVVSVVIVRNADHMMHSKTTAHAHTAMKKDQHVHRVISTPR